MIPLFIEWYIISCEKIKVERAGQPHTSRIYRDVVIINRSF